MFVAFMAVVILATVPLAGGNVAQLAGIRIRGWWLVAVALLMQVAITGVLQSWPHGVLVGSAPRFVRPHRRGHLVEPAAAGPADHRPRRIAQRLRHRAERRHPAGLRPGPRRQPALTCEDFNNSGVLAHPILAPLGDVVATPAWLPFRNVISIGDLIALIGVAVLAHAVVRRLALDAGAGADVDL